MNREQLFELAGKSGGRTTKKIRSEVPILIMSADALETFVAAVAVAIGEPMRVSASRVKTSTEDIMLWPDGAWCYRYELPEMSHRGDDYVTMLEGTPAYAEAMGSIEAGRVL